MIKAYLTLAIISAVVLAALVYGFTQVGSPGHRRALELDNERISGLTSIKSAVQGYHTKNKKLPTTLDDLLKDSNYSYLDERIQDPETEQKYEYSIVNQTSYKLCATFVTDSEDEKNKKGGFRDYYVDKEFKHPKGHHCFNLNVTAYNTYSSPSPKPIGPNLFIEADKNTVKKGELFNLTVTGKSLAGFESVWWGVKDTINPNSNEIKGTVDGKPADLWKAQGFGECVGKTECKFSRKITIDQPGSYRIFANARQIGYKEAGSLQASESSGLEEVAITVTE